MEIDPELIPPGIHIVGAADVHGLQHPAAGQKYHTTCLLSANGELLMYHPNHLTDWALFQVADVSEIEEVEYLEPTLIQPKKYKFWRFSQIYTALILFIFTLSQLYVIYGQATSGYVSLGSSDDGSVSSTDFTVVIGLIVFTLLAGVSVFFPLFYSFRASGYSHEFATPSRIRISTKQGGEGYYVAKPLGSKMHSLISRLAIVFFACLLMGMIPASDLLIVGVFFTVLLGGGLVVELGLRHLRNESLPTEIGYLRSGSMYQFYKTLQDLHRAPSEEEGLDVEPDPSSTVQDRLSNRIEEPLSVLYTHESFLDELTAGEWKAMLTANKIYFSLAQIRRCTEKMLLTFIADKNIKIKPQNRGIKTMMDRLRNEGVLTPEVNKWLELIKTVANPAAHDMKEDVDDFLTAFRAFVSFTTWFVESQATTEEE